MIFSCASQKVSLSLDTLLAGGGRGISSTLLVCSSTISRRLFWVTLDCVTNANIGEVYSLGGSDTDDASVGPVLTGGDVDKEEIKETLGDGAWGSWYVSSNLWFRTPCQTGRQLLWSTSLPFLTKRFASDIRGSWEHQSWTWDQQHVCKHVPSFLHDSHKRISWY